MTHQKQHGFTLIELMITVAIIGILAAVAFPLYSGQILKGRRAEARTALADLLQQEERYFTQRNCYLAFDTDTTTGAATAKAPSPPGACGGVTAASVPFKTWSGDSLANSAYILFADTCPSGTGTFSIQDCVLVKAQPLRPDTVAGTLTMTSTGVKGCFNASNPNVCWK